ncbi:MAG TPA: VCBS domain-containing protein [Stellaceae bacterium]|nr:VCBS domain-containing protein [Stellaceae bacterium]
MPTTQPIPTQIADAPDAGFRGPFFEINPAAPGPTHLSRSAAALALPTPHPDAPAVCPPAPANSSVAPLVVHEPPAGQQVDITLVPNQPLTFDFNPLDAHAVRHGDDLTLTFADGGVVVLHHIAQDGNPLPTPLQLPDGTIISPCELLQALPGEQGNSENGKIPNEKIPFENFKIPLEHIIPLGAHPVVTPFELPSLGPGLVPLGGLPPEGFFTTVIFPPPGNGGFPPGPPGPPGPPPPPPPPGSFLVGYEDSNSGVVPNLVDNPGQTTLTISGNFLTDFTNSGGLHGVNGSPTPTFSNAVSVSTGTATGEFGTLAVTAGGTYTYTVDVATEAAVNQLGSDRISEALNQQYSGAAPYLAPLEDEFVVTVSNGSHTQSELLALYIEGADATKTTNAVTGVGAATVLLTYTDLYDPAHSFQEILTVNAAATTLTTDAPIQPGDPGLVSLALVSGTTSISSIEVAGGTIVVPGETLDAAHHALTTIIDPQITPGTSFHVLDAPTSWADLPAGGTAAAAGQYLYAEGHAVTLDVAPASAADGTGVILNLGTVNGAGTGAEIGGLGSDTLVWNPGTAPTYYNGMAGAVVSGTATNGDSIGITFTNPNLATVGHMETVTIGVTTGETTAQMAQALAVAIDGDATLTALNGGHALADYTVGASSFQFNESLGSNAFGTTQYSEFATPAVFGHSPSESLNGQDGLDTLQVQAPGQNIDTTNPATLAHLSNIDLFDLGAAANAAGSNTLTLDPNSVLQLTHNETSTITSFSGGANAIWILGDASDTVKLTGFVSGSNPNPMISGPITSGAQDPIPNVLPAAAVGVPGGVDVGGTPETHLVATGPVSPTQMVGFTEFTGTAAGGNVVHVYVENAIATAGHVHVT